MVLQTQQWLNETYGDDVRYYRVIENGQTGWPTIYALTRALQIELGIQSTADNFGPTTRRLFVQRYPNGVQQQNDGDEATSNVYSIIQGALWCKGYSTGNNITQHFYDGTGKAVRDLKRDMGIGGDSSVDVDIMSALLSMQQFVLLSAYGGTKPIRSAQQEINRTYREYTGIIPTDGLYGREMNTALIQVLQALEGFTPSEATGNFGEGTKSRLKTITASNAADNQMWLWLASTALACNGIGEPIKQWTTQFTPMLRNFQQRYALNVTGVIDPTTWMSLLTSKGDPDRPCIACDTRFEMTDARLSTLKSDGYQIVGRYLTEPGQESLDPKDYFKAIRPGELERILATGMKFFPIFQEYSTSLEDFTSQNGEAHAKSACAAAQRLGVPPTPIFFAVDFDATDDQVTSNIIPYFRAIHSTLGGGYGVGIYASRNICTRVITAGYASSAFVSDMSTGFSGNLGFPIPDLWAYDQFAEINNYNNQGWDLDRVASSGRLSPCAALLPEPPQPVPDPDPESPDSDPLLSWVLTVEQECYETLSGMGVAVSSYRGFIGEFILDWLRKPEYWSSSGYGLWNLYTPELSIPAEMATARQLCATVCAGQPAIKGTLPRRDIAHMAATALGYLTWGVDNDVSEYGLGDLGGWALDLLQLWGNYDNSGNKDDLSLWMYSQLGSVDGATGFGYDDVLADADAWLIAKGMKDNPGSTSLSDAMRAAFARSETNRIIRFYDERFASNADNIVNAYSTMADGLDALGLTNIGVTIDMLKSAAGTNELPSRQEAEISARAFAAFISQPRH